MGREEDLDPVVYVRPFRMVIHLFSEDRDLAHEAEGLDEAVEYESAMELALLEIPIG